MTRTFLPALLTALFAIALALAALVFTAYGQAGLYNCQGETITMTTSGLNIIAMNATLCQLPGMGTALLKGYVFGAYFLNNSAVAFVAYNNQYQPVTLEYNVIAYNASSSTWYSLGTISVSGYYVLRVSTNEVAYQVTFPDGTVFPLGNTWIYVTSPFTGSVTISLPSYASQWWVTLIPFAVVAGVAVRRNVRDMAVAMIIAGIIAIPIISMLGAMSPAVQALEYALSATLIFLGAAMLYAFSTNAPR